MSREKHLRDLYEMFVTGSFDLQQKMLESLHRLESRTEEQTITATNTSSPAAVPSSLNTTGENIPRATNATTTPAEDILSSQ